MTGDSETIKEFLVALGFKVNEASYKKFDSAVGRATTNVFKLGASVAVVSTAIEAFLAKITDGLEKLYYSSQRNQSTVTGIKSIGFALSQMGSTADAALNSIESLGSFIRSNPGSRNFLMRLGVDPEHVNNADLALKDLARTFRQMPYFKAKIYGDFLGIDEKSLQALIKDTGAFEERYKEILKLFNVDTDDAARRSVAFQRNLRDLGAYGEAAAIKLGSTLIPVGIHLIQALEQVFEWGSQLIELAGPFKVAFAGIATAISFVFAPLLTLGALLIGIIDDIYTFKEGGKSLIGDVIDGFNRLLTYLRSTAIGRWVLNQFGEDGPQPQNFMPSPQPQNAVPGGPSNNNPGNLRRWGNAPIRNGFAVFPNAQAGLAALVGNLKKYGQRGWNTIDSIVNHWAPESDGNYNNGSYKRFLSGLLGKGVHERLNLNDPNTLAALARGITKFEQGKDPYSAELYSAAGAGRMSATPTINQNTTINVTGVPDPSGMSRAIAAEQSNVNNRLVRQSQGVPR